MATTNHTDSWYRAIGRKVRKLGRAARKFVSHCLMALSAHSVFWVLGHILHVALS